MSQGSDDFITSRTADAMRYARTPGASRRRNLLATTSLFICGLLISAGVSATIFEDPDFTETEIARPDGNAWVGVVGLQFVEDGSRAFAWEREGRVWILDDDAPVATPFLDISDEVLGWRDHGMLGFALDPGFRTNGYVYLFYAVDRHHVDYCVEDPSGTGPSQCDPSNYDPAFSILETRATIGRVTRYQAVQPAGEADYLNATRVNYDSRTVLLGASLGPDACPLIYDTHGIGSLVFGTDGSLLVGCGDSARAGDTDAGSERFTAWQEALDDGLLRTEENVGAFRAQMINSHSGKILRIDPTTGNGLASNPFYQPGAPRSAASRVWTLGVRNGYRMTIRPGTGSHDPADGNPGVLYLGDVGWRTREDFNTVSQGGANLGWPLFEGIEAQPDYVLVSPDNMDAPNPLAGGSCDNFFNFTDLIIQQTQAASPSWPNPCDTGQEITSVTTFQHLPPVLDWQHDVDSARFPAFGAGDEVVAVEVGQTAPDGSSVSGVPFDGSASTTGVFYSGDDFPAAYRNTYFHADYGAQWIRNFEMDVNDRVVAVTPFLSDTGGVVYVSTNPVSGSLYYISWASFVRQVTYAPGGNRPPTASFTASPRFGPAPLTVTLDASSSVDPEGGALSYDWDFGDGGTSTTGPVVNHDFDPGDGQPDGYLVTLTVTDAGGATDSSSLIVSPNNSPPVVSITSPVDASGYSTSAVTNLPLTADLSDAEHNVSSLVCGWEIVLHHNDHIHSDPPLTGCSQATNVGPTSCTSEAFWYAVHLTVTDPEGLTTSARSRIFPDCGGDGPTANADVASTVIGGTVDVPVLANDTDDGWVNHHTVEVLMLPGEGIATVDEITGLVSYQHTGSADTTDVFSYEVRDNHGNLSAEATVTVTVSGTAPNDPPVLNSIGARSVTMGDTLTISVSATDLDGPPLLETSAVNLPTGASFVDNGSGSGEFTWTPVSGDDSGSPYYVTFIAEDGAGATDTEIVEISVSAASTGFQQDPTTGLLSIELENFDGNTPQGGHSWSPLSAAGASGGDGMEATPNNGTNNNTGYISNSPRLDYLVNFTQTGTHYVWIRARGPASTDDSVHVGLNGAGPSSSDRITGWGSGGFTWSDETMDDVRATINVAAPGEQTLNLWMREDGTQVDKIVLTTDSSLVPTSFGSTGPAESPRGPPQPSLVFDIESDFFTVDEGETALQTSTVSLDTSDSQAIPYAIGSDAGWLTTSPDNGTTPSGSITIEVDPTGLLAGQYTGTLTASAAGYVDDTIDVTLTVTGSSAGFQQDPTTGLVSMEVENNDANTPQGGHAWSPFQSGGASGGSGFEATPNNGTNNNTGYASNSPRLDFLVNFTQVGTHYVWVRGQGPTGSDDSVHVGLNGAGQSSSDRITGFARTAWSWSDETMDSPRATIEVTAPGEQMVNLWMREDGVRVDKIVLTTNASLQPTSFGPTGPPESPRGPPQPSLIFDTESESFTVDEGETALQTSTVTLDTSDTQAVAYTLSSDAVWLDATPASGTTPSGSITIEADPTGLSAGQYTGTLTASASGYINDTIDVTLTVVGASTGFQQDPTTGLLSIELENFDGNTPQGGHSWSPLSAAGASGGDGMEATPNNGTNNNTGYISNSPRLDYLVNFTQTGTHYVWIRARGPASTDDSVHVGLNGAGPSSSDRITGWGSGGFTWSDETMDDVRATINVAAPGEQTLNLWMREDGTQVDKIVLTTDSSLVPTSFGSTGPAESPRGPPQPSLQFSQGSATFSVDVGETTVQTQNVTLDTSDSQSVAYTVSSDAAWLTSTPDNGTTPSGTIVVEADPTGLSAGQYTGTLTASAAGYNDDTISVTLNVQADLFVTYDFSTGDESDWTTVEASGDIADWDVVGGQYRQLVPASSTAAGTDTYLLGSYVFLNSQSGLDDFEFTVDVTPEAAAFPRRGDDVGVMFRYVDDDNYYRLAINSKFGQTRLERRIAGVFSTIAVTSQGYLPNQTIRIGVRVQGNAMLIYRDYGGGSSVLDNDPYFAGYDSGIAAGTIALYTQSEAAFDNVVLRSLSPASRVGMVRPVPFQVGGGSSVAAQAVIINPGGSPDVGFEIDSVACGASTETQPQLFEATCAPAGAGEHTVEAILNDPTEIDRDTAPAVATGGIGALTLGNSNTNGTGDQFIADNISLDIVVSGSPVGPRQVGFRGYQAVLHDRLTTDSTYTMSSVFFNEGIPGDTADQLVYDRLPSILERHPDFTDALVMIGTNEANSGSPPPSGLGCSGASCTGTYKGQLLDLVDILGASGVQPIIARIPPIFGQSGTPYSNPFGASTRNTAVQEYNAAANEVISERGLQAGPDFFDEFLGGSENRYTLFDDFLHPNSLGHRWMANSWKQVLAPDGTTVFVLEGICVRRSSSSCVNPTPYKQNLRTVGDTYYLDRSYTLTSIPSSLAGGVWLIPENDDKTNTRDDYLEFTVDRDVDVYVAFTPTASSLPNWMAPFSPTGEVVGVTAGTPTLDLYSRFYAAGSTIILGGNVAQGIAGGGNNNFVVVVVPR